MSEAVTLGSVFSFTRSQAKVGVCWTCEKYEGGNDELKYFIHCCCFSRVVLCYGVLYCVRIFFLLFKKRREWVGGVSDVDSSFEIRD